MKVSLKKKWRYEYDNIDEMNGHYTSMVAAQFNIEHYDEKNLVAIYSQIIEEIHNEKHIASDEIIYTRQEEKQHERQQCSRAKTKQCSSAS